MESQRTDVLPAFLSTESPKFLLDYSRAPGVDLAASAAVFHRAVLPAGVWLRCAGRRSHAAESPLSFVRLPGDGERRATRRSRKSGFATSGLEENVLLLGDVDHETCLALMSACDVFLRPTLEDGDSISVREALSMGVPVVASRIGTRPAGAILFHSGDVEDMLAKIALALAEKRGGQTESAGSMDRLLEIYRQVDGSEGSLCLN